MSVDSILILGVNHKTAPVEVREKLAFSDDTEIVFEKLKQIPGCKEFCFLSTCNRVEVIFISEHQEKTSQAIREFLFARCDLTLEETINYTYLHQGKNAINHLFRVSSSLDSMVVGEPQILGQLKDAYRDAADHYATGIILNRFLKMTRLNGR